jgi:hypothetical protein
MIGPRVKVAYVRLSVFDPMPASVMNDALPGEQQRMDRLGPVLAWCAAAVFVGPACGDAALRLAISEERANDTESECWCGAAKYVPATDEAKCDFLFHICTTRRVGLRISRARFNRPQPLMVLALSRLKGCIAQVSQS